MWETCECHLFPDDPNVGESLDDMAEEPIEPVAPFDMFVIFDAEEDRQLLELRNRRRVRFDPDNAWDDIDDFPAADALTNILDTQDRYHLEEMGALRNLE